MGLITRFNYINTDVTDTGIDRFFYERGRDIMYINYSLSILGRQCSGSSHCIAAMSTYHFLVGLQTPKKESVLKIR